MFTFICGHLGVLLQCFSFLPNSCKLRLTNRRGIQNDSFLVPQYLPPISSLIMELKATIEFVIKIYKENPLLFDEVSNFALTWVIEQ